MTRLVTGVVLAVSVIAAILFLPVAALAVVAVGVAGLAAHEYLQIVGTSGAVRQTLAIAATMLLCAAIATEGVLDPVPVLLVALGWVAADVLATGRSMPSAAADAMAPVYVGAPLGMLVMVHVLQGASATLLAVLLVVVSDSSQYYVGRRFGRRALAPAISPKKTMEGAIGGLICGTLFLVLAGSWLFPSASVASLALLGMAGVALGICGDLFESRLKRIAGVKDSSGLIPGHGGMLDRIDALLFVAPAFYLYFSSATG